MTPGPGGRRARAKINLSLHVVGRRADGYHRLDSLVVFADIGDWLTVEPAAGLSLTLAGPFGFELDAGAENIVLRAAMALQAHAPRDARGALPGAALHLEKRLPVASGVGGGSADAAATLHALNALWGLGLGAETLADIGLRLGADVPVCLAGPAPLRMRGVGEQIDPAPPLPPLWAVLANPGEKLETPEVFRRLESPDGAPPPAFPASADLGAWLAWLAATRNDLEAPARALRPVVADVVSALAGSRGCVFSRMSGSGATCFGLFEAEADALAAAAALTQAQPRWWTAAGPLATGPLATEPAPAER